MTFYEILAAHYTKEVPPQDPDPYVGFNWVPITRFFGEGTTWRSSIISRVQVTVDIKPGSLVNSINPKSQAVIPVAILSTSVFDASIIDPLSVRFGPSGATEAHGRGHIEDANGDGKPDLVLHFKTQDTGINCGDSSASLTGKTFGGQEIQGSDSIQTVGCR